MEVKHSYSLGGGESLFMRSCMCPAFWDIQAQVSIDLVFSGPEVDVQGFFDQQYRVLWGFIQYSDITPVYCMSILPRMLCNC